MVLMIATCEACVYVSCVFCCMMSFAYIPGLAICLLYNVFCIHTGSCYLMGSISKHQRRFGCRIGAARVGSQIGGVC